MTTTTPDCRLSADQWLMAFLLAAGDAGTRLRSASSKQRNDGFRRFWHGLEKIDLAANLNQDLREIARDAFTAGLSGDRHALNRLVARHLMDGEKVLHWDGNSKTWDDRLGPLLIEIEPEIESLPTPQ